MIGADDGLQILKAKETDQRSALFARAIKSGESMQVANRKLLLRMRLCVAHVSALCKIALLTLFVRQSTSRPNCQSASDPRRKPCWRLAAQRCIHVGHDCADFHFLALQVVSCRCCMDRLGILVLCP